MRRSVAKVLSTLGWQPENSEQRSLCAVAEGRIDDAVKEGTGSVEPLIAALSDPSYDALEIIQALGKIKDPRAVDALTTIFMGTASARTRKAAVQAAKSPIAVIPFLNADADVRAAAARALGKIGEPSAVLALVTYSNPENSRVSEEADRAVIKMENAAIEPLSEILLHPVDTPFVHSGVVQERVIEALGGIGGSRAVEALVASVNEAEGYVRSRAATMLGKIGDVRAVEPLVSLLNDKSEYSGYRSIAARALVMIGDKCVVEPLIAVFKEERDTDVREAAIAALGEIGDLRAVEPLTAGLSEPSQSIRVAAARALGKMGDVRIVEPLIAALKGGQQAESLRAMEILGEMGDLAVDHLLPLVQDGGPNLRQAAIDIFVRIGSEQSIKLVVEMVGFTTIFEQAMKIYREAQPKSESLALPSFDKDRLSKSYLMFSTLTKLDPTSVDTLIMKGQCASDSRDQDLMRLTLPDLERALELAPNNARLFEVRGEFLSRLHVSGRDEIEDGTESYYTTKIGNFRKALEIDPNYSSDYGENIAERRTTNSAFRNYLQTLERELKDHFRKQKSK